MDIVQTAPYQATYIDQLVGAQYIRKTAYPYICRENREKFGPFKIESVDMAPTQALNWANSIKNDCLKAVRVSSVEYGIMGAITESDKNKKYSIVTFRRADEDDQDLYRLAFIDRNSNENWIGSIAQGLERRIKPYFVNYISSGSIKVESDENAVLTHFEILNKQTTQRVTEFVNAFIEKNLDPMFLHQELFRLDQDIEKAQKSIAIVQKSYATWFRSETQSRWQEIDTQMTELRTHILNQYQR